MKSITLIDSEFSKELELQIAPELRAGFPSPAEEYLQDSLDFNRDLIKHPESTFYGRVIGDSMIEAGINDGDIAVIDKSRESHQMGNHWRKYRKSCVHRCHHHQYHADSHREQRPKGDLRGSVLTL